MCPAAEMQACVGTGHNTPGRHKDAAEFPGCCGPCKPREVWVTLTQRYAFEFGCRTDPALPGGKKRPLRTWTGLTVPQTESPPALGRGGGQPL